MSCTITAQFNKDNINMRGVTLFTAGSDPILKGTGFDITNIKLELGSIATPFVRSYGEELALCQRYYRKTPYQQVFRMSYYTNDLVVFEYPIGVDMRITPTIVGKPNIDMQLGTLTGTVIEGCTFTITKTSNGLSIGANKTNHGCTDGILVIKNSCGFDSEMY